MSKRKLTIDEINLILEVISPLPQYPKKIGEHICSTIREGVRKQLLKISIYPQMVAKLRQKVERFYHTSLVQPGENVGIYAAQTIGEKTTQLVLNAFHMSGAGEKMTTSGLPRLKELLGATQNPKHQSLRIYFKDRYKTVQELRENVWSIIPQLSFKNLVSRCDIFSRHETKTIDLEWYQDIEAITGFPLIYLPEWYLDYTLNIKKIAKYHISISSVIESLEKTFSNIKVFMSPLDICHMHIYVEDINLDREEAIRHLRHVVRHEISNIIISGFKDIDAYPVKVTDENETHWVIDTNGGSLIDIVGHPLVDPYNTVSDNMWQIYETFGIEATRTFLIEEFTKVVSAEGDIGVRHISLMVDMMLSNGTISPNNRHGMDREQVGPLGKAAFEETDKNLAISSVFGETDNLSGVTASTILGKIPRTGSGLMDVKIDFSMLEKMRESLPRTSGRSKLAVVGEETSEENGFVTY